MSELKYFVIDLRRKSIAQCKNLDDAEEQLKGILEQGVDKAVMDINGCQLMVIEGKECKIKDFDVRIQQ